MALFPFNKNQKNNIQRSFPDELSLSNLGVATSRGYIGKRDSGADGVGRVRLELGGEEYHFEYDVDAEVEVINPKSYNAFEKVDVVVKVNGFDNVRPSTIGVMNKDDDSVYNQDTYDRVKEVLVDKLGGSNRKDFSVPSIDASVIKDLNPSLNTLQNVATEKSILFSEKHELDPNKVLDPNDSRLAYRALSLLGKDSLEVKIDENSQEGDIDVHYVNKGGPEGAKDNDFEYIFGNVPIEISFKGLDDVKITTELSYTLNNTSTLEGEKAVVLTVDPEVLDANGNTVFERSISGIDVLPDRNAYSPSEINRWAYVTPENETYDYIEPHFLLKYSSDISRAEVQHAGGRHETSLDNEFLHRNGFHEEVLDVVKKHVNKNLPYLNGDKLNDMLQANIETIGDYSDTPVRVQDITQEDYLRRTAIQYEEAVRPKVEISDYPLGVPKGEEKSTKYWIENNLEKFARGVSDPKYRNTYLNRNNRMRAHQWVTITNHQNQRMKAKLDVESYFSAINQDGDNVSPTHRISAMEVLEVAVPLLDSEGVEQGWVLSDEKPVLTTDLKQELEKTIAKNLAEKVDTNSSVFKEGFDIDFKPIKPETFKEGLFSTEKMPSPKVGTPEQILEAKNTADNADIAHIELASLSEGTQKIASVFSQTIKNPVTPDGIEGAEVRVVSPSELNLAIKELTEFSNTISNTNSQKERYAFTAEDLPKERYAFTTEDLQEPVVGNNDLDLGSQQPSQPKERYAFTAEDLPKERYAFTTEDLPEVEIELDVDGQKPPQPKERYAFSVEDLPEVEPESDRDLDLDSQSSQKPRERYAFSESDLARAEEMIDSLNDTHAIEDSIEISNQNDMDEPSVNNDNRGPSPR